METVTSIQKLKELLKNEEEFILLKHSLTCPISASAKGEAENFERSSDTSVYFIPIQEARDVSQFAAEELKISHESPQAFYIKKGSVEWNATHFDITKTNLDKAVIS
ncbi:bacillithiol system redox-active protein YtxJ [Salimicrobium salexigens]|uniref:Bacillithiol system protein YtxJ n=1 Tax=Salimicrobium salexigens TaxID=908941 RepID=A0ABY1KYV8_9BACI|nr:bacillithiol system redox-active protein YtxJ [Salimicrobium salexigens]SIS94957.1 bacillithiol system protein YtxJ [Salimicrobium salexigens]